MRPEDYVRLRWNAGVGLRYATPVGPLAVDYGFNLTRQVEDEPFGAFHFSIGLF
jgi:outer membrane translocation and assembly module TamA